MASAKKEGGQRQLSFIENFGLSGAAAVVSKSVAAPIERVKLLIQNQKEMLKQGLIDRPYDGMGDCIHRTHSAEGFLSFWKGNLANCLRYFPTQALNFAFKDKIKSGSPYKELHLQQKTENNGYYMVGNCLEFEPAMLLGSKKKLQKEKTIAKDSTYAYNRTSRSAATTNNSLIVESGRMPEISKSPQASPRARLRNSVYSKKKGNTPKNKKLNGSMKIGHLLKKRFQ